MKSQNAARASTPGKRVQPGGPLSGAVKRGGDDTRLKLVKSPVDDLAIERLLIRRGVEETVRLCEARGEVFRKPRSKDHPFKKLDELEVMLQRGEIDGVQYEAGRRYGDRFREVHFRGTYRSSLRLNDRSSTGANYDAVLLDRVPIFAKLNSERRRSFGNRPDIVALCDAVLGQDFRFPAHWPARRQAVEMIAWALTRLAYTYGLLWWK